MPGHIIWFRSHPPFPGSKILFVFADRGAKQSLIIHRSASSYKDMNEISFFRLMSLKSFAFLVIRAAPRHNGGRYFLVILLRARLRFVANLI